MSYYKVLGLEREPFSTSPDPDFFYQTEERRTALANILIEIRLKRGLSIILGDIGTGKTTLSRKLFQTLGSREDIAFYMILDPSYDSEYLFLLSLVKTFGLEIGNPDPTTLDFKEALEHFLFQKGVSERKTVVLIIDEAQKLNATSLEVLRMLLNYETNRFKLLQLVVLGQMELLPQLGRAQNLMDRVTLKHTLGPFSQQETREMIEFRLHQAGYNGSEKLFRDETFSLIHSYTQGYPRRIAMLCHKALKSLVMNSRPAVDSIIIREIIDFDLRLGWQKRDLLLKNNY
ncbi:MAG: AAA family ATPase [Candidatus Omnitrophota bacterium]|nr:AAA family ATPase [Candidatus Omnitrophota bacterium]